MGYQKHCLDYKTDVMDYKYKAGVANYTAGVILDKDAVHAVISSWPKSNRGLKLI